MPVNREPDPKMLESLGLDFNQFDPIEYVARSGGYRYGDCEDLFPEVQPDRLGNYNFVFRTVDSYTFSTPNRPELNSINVGDKVLATLIEGRLKLQCQDYIIGSTPPYIRELYKKYREHLKISVFKVNPEVPYEYQFLLLASLNQKIGIPFSELEYQPINE